MKPISASRTAFCIGSFVAPSNAKPLTTVLTIIPRLMNSRIVSVTAPKAIDPTDDKRIPGPQQIEEAATLRALLKGNAYSRDAFVRHHLINSESGGAGLGFLARNCLIDR